MSSGVAKEDDLEKLLNIWQTGKDQSDEFCTKQILSTEISFHVIRRYNAPMVHTKKVIKPRKIELRKVKPIMSSMQTVIATDIIYKT